MQAVDDYRLNFASRPDLTLIGEEREPLVVIDNAFAHPDRLIRYAAETARFGPAGGAYPGIRAAVPEALNIALFYALQPLAQQVYPALKSGRKIAFL